MKSVFTHLIVTAPNEQTALVYRHQLYDLKRSLSFLEGTQVLCVSDPDGDRVGSGGGTLNAVHILSKSVGIDFIVSKAKVLIIHSGGDSRRIPIHSGMSYCYVISIFF